MSLALSENNMTYESKRANFDFLKTQESIAYLGKTAIRAEQLGINDELTPIYNYLLNGEKAITGIELDAKTKIAEHLKDTPFKTFVEFSYTGDDFISQKDKISMKKMMDNTLNVLQSEVKHDTSLQKELRRAEIEKREFEKISEWYESAPINSYLIFESLPISKEKFAVSRIYQKSDNSTLKSCFLSLFNSSIERFNKFRGTISPNLTESSDELDMLSNCYVFNDENLSSLSDFSKYYISKYDESLGSDDIKYSFGIEIDKNKQIQNGIEKVEKSPTFVSIYIDALKKIAKSDGQVNTEILNIYNNLSIKDELKLGQTITTKLAAKIMDNVIEKIACAIDLGDEKILQQIEKSGSKSTAIIEAVFEHTSAQASSAGLTYESNGCSKIDRSENSSAEGENTSEANALDQAFRTKRDKIGNIHIGICRIEGCPSHKLSKENDSKKSTLVGGCEVCMECQALFDQDKDPIKIYRERIAQEAWEEYFQEIIDRSNANTFNINSTKLIN